MNCKYYFNNKEVDQRELDSLVSNYKKVRFSKPKASDIESTIVSASNKMTLKEELHEYRGLDNSLYTSTSVVVDRQYPYQGVSTGELAALEGTAIHKHLEDFIKSKDRSKFKVKLKDSYGENFAEYFSDFIENLESNGTLLSEVILKSDDHAIAGTADLIHIANNGKITIYDFKTASQTKYKSGQNISGELSPIFDLNAHWGYKDARYSMQGLVYKKLLEKTLGRTDLDIDVSIIPIEVHKENSSTDISRLFMLKPKSIFDQGKVKSEFLFTEYNERKVAVEFGDELSYKREFGKKDSSSQILEFILDDAYSPANLYTTKQAQLKVESNTVVFEDGSEGFKDSSGKKIKYTSTSKPDRIEQVLNKENSLRKSELNYSAEAWASIFKKEIVSTGTEDDLDVNTARVLKFKEQYKNYKNVEVYPLSSVKGLEDHVNVLVVEYDGITDFISLASNLNTKLDLPNNNIMGNFMSNHQAKRKNKIDLKATVGNKELLRLGLIIPQFKHMQKATKIGRVIAYDVKHDAYTNTHIDTLLPTVKTIINDPHIKPLLNNNLTELYTEENLDPSNYSQDYVNSYFNFIKTESEENKRNVFKKKLYDDLVNNRDDLEKVQDLLENRLIQLMDAHAHNSNSLDDSALQKNKEFRALSYALMSIKGVKIMYDPNKTMGFIHSYLATKLTTGSKLADVVGLSIDHASTNVLMDYNKEIEQDKAMFKLIEDAYHRRSGLPRSLNKVTSNRLLFKELLVKEKIGEDSYNTMRLKMTKEEREGLDSDQIKFIEWYADKIEATWKNFVGEARYKQIVSGDQWKRGMIPLISGRLADQLSIARDSEGGAVTSTKELFKIIKTDVKSKFDFTGMVSNDVSLSSLSDHFTNQLGSGTDGNNSRRSMLGFDSSDNYSRDSSNYSSDLERILNVFKMESFKQKHYKKPMAYAQAALAIIAVEENKYMTKENIDEIQDTNLRRAVESHISTNVLSKRFSRGSEFERKAALAMDNLNGAAATAILVGNISVSSINMMINVTNIISALTSQSSTFLGVESNMASPSHFYKYMTTLPNKGSLEKHRAIMAGYRAATDPKSAVSTVYTDKGINLSKITSAIFTETDYRAREALFLSQLHKDGNYDAHTVTTKYNDHNNPYTVLEYDETKDKRFIAGKKSEGYKFQSQEHADAYKLAIKKNLAKEGGLDGDESTPIVDRKMLRGYDNNLIAQRREYMQKIIDAIPKDNQVAAQGNVWTNLYLTFKTFMLPKIDRFYHVRDKRRGSPDSDYIVKQLENGSLITEWEDGDSEGAYQTLVHMFHELKEQNYKVLLGKGLEKDQLRNYKRTAIDLGIFGLLSALGSMIFDEEEEDTFLSTRLARSSMELLQFYNPLSYVNTLTAVPMAVSYTNNVVSSFADLISSPSNRNLTKTIRTALPSSNSIYQLVKDMESEEEK